MPRTTDIPTFVDAFLEKHRTLWAPAPDFRPFDAYAQRQLTELSRRCTTLGDDITATQAGSPNGDISFAPVGRALDTLLRAIRRYRSDYEAATWGTTLDRASLIADLEAIRDSEACLNFHAAANRFYFDINASPDGTDLGTIRTLFTLSQLTSASDPSGCIRYDRTPDTQAQANSHFHPHATPAGHICFGEARSILSHAIKNGNLLAVFDAMVSHANTYDSRDAYTSLSSIVPSSRRRPRRRPTSTPAPETPATPVPGPLGTCPYTDVALTEDNSHFEFTENRRVHESVLRRLSNNYITSIRGNATEIYVLETMVLTIGPYQIPNTPQFVQRCPECNSYALHNATICTCGHNFQDPSAPADTGLRTGFTDTAPPPPAPEPAPVPSIDDPGLAAYERHENQRRERERQRERDRHIDPTWARTRTRTLEQAISESLQIIEPDTPPEPEPDTPPMPASTTQLSREDLLAMLRSYTT